MAETSFDKFTKLSGYLREGVLKPVYLLLGPDLFLTTLFLSQLKAEFKKKFGATGEISLLYGDDLKRDDLDGYVSGGGLFSSATLVIIQNINGLEPSARKLLEKVVERENQGLIIALTHPESYRVPQWIGKIGQHAQLVPVDQPFENEIPRIIHRFAELRKRKIHPQAVELLMQLTGNNLAMIEHEIEKLDLYLDESDATITADTVQNSIAAVPHATILSLFDAVNQRNGAMAIEAFSDICSKDDSIPYLVISLYNHLNKILGFKDYSTIPDTAVSRSISGSGAPKYHRILFAASQKYDAGELESALSELAEIDYRFRQQNIPAMTYFSTWVANHLG